MKKILRRKMEQSEIFLTLTSSGAWQLGGIGSIGLLRQEVGRRRSFGKSDPSHHLRNMGDKHITIAIQRCIGKSNFPTRIRRFSIP